MSLDMKSSAHTGRDLQSDAAAKAAEKSAAHTRKDPYLRSKYTKVLAALNEPILTNGDFEACQILRISWFHTYDRIYCLSIDVRPPMSPQYPIRGFAKFVVARSTPNFEMSPRGIVHSESKMVPEKYLTSGDWMFFSSDLERLSPNGPQELIGGGPTVYIEYISSREHLFLTRTTLKTLWSKEFRQHSKDMGCSIDFAILEEENREIIRILLWLGNIFRLDSVFWEEQLELEQ